MKKEIIKFLLFPALAFMLVSFAPCGVSASIFEGSKEHRSRLALEIQNELKIIKTSLSNDKKYTNEGITELIELWGETRQKLTKLSYSLRNFKSGLVFFDSAKLAAQRVKEVSRSFEFKTQVLENLFHAVKEEFTKTGEYNKEKLKKISNILTAYSISRHKAMDVDSLPVYRASFENLTFLKSSYKDFRASGEVSEKRVHTEIIELSKKLNGNVEEIESWVDKNIKLQTYFGYLKGAYGTLQEKSGNHLDRASLLYSLLESSGYKARYVSGILRYEEAEIRKYFNIPLEIPVNAALKQTGVSYEDGGLYAVWVEFYGKGGWVEALPENKQRKDIVKVFGTSREIPEAFRYTVDIDLEVKDTRVAVAKRLLLSTLMDIDGKVTFSPETELDQTILAAIYAVNTEPIRNLLSLSPYRSLTIPGFLVKVKPSIYIGNKNFRTELSTFMGMPITLRLSVKLNKTQIAECSHMIPAGGHTAFKFSVSGIAKQTQKTPTIGLELITLEGKESVKNTFPLTKESQKALGKVTDDYIYNNMRLTLNNLDTYQDKLFFSPFLTENAVSVTFMHIDVFNTPLLMIQSGVDIDVQRDMFFTADRDTSQNGRTCRFVREKGGLGNIAEHHVLSRFSKNSGEENPAISAFNIINRMSNTGVDILRLSTLEDLKKLDNIPMDILVKQDIEAAVKEGAIVTTPSKLTRLKGWVGTGYIVSKKNTAGYFLSGGKAGGLAESLDRQVEGFKQGYKSSIRGVEERIEGAMSAKDNRTALERSGILANVSGASNVNVTPKMTGSYKLLGVIAVIIIIIALVVALAI